MKKLLLFIVAGLGLALQSCTLLGGAIGNKFDDKISHQEVLDSMTTKADVILRFGIPTREWTYDTLEVWHYSLGEVMSANTQHLTETMATTNEVSFRKTVKFVEFCFVGDKVVSRRSQNVNLTESDYKNRKTGSRVGVFFDLLFLTHLWWISV